MRISSPTNPRIKAYAQLLGRKARLEEGRFLVEGAREIERAWKGGIGLEVLLSVDSPSSEEQQLLQKLGEVERLEVSPPALAKLSSRENPAGLIAVAQTPSRLLSSFRLPSAGLVLVAVGLEKPGNLGAVLRSADASGADAVLVVGGVDLYNPQVIRNSTGVVFSLPTFAASESQALDWLHQQDIPLVATTPHTQQLYWEADLRGPVAIAVGPEHQGLAPSWLEAAAHKVRIPMSGRADSLNVSVSAALLLFEAVRQRLQS